MRPIIFVRPNYIEKRHEDNFDVLFQQPHGWLAESTQAFIVTATVLTKWPNWLIITYGPIYNISN